MADQIHCYLDRFEGTVAVLIAEDQEIIFPRRLMPEDAGQGDHFILTIEPDPQSKQAIAREINDLQKRLKGGGK